MFLGCILNLHHSQPARNINQASILKKKQICHIVQWASIYAASLGLSTCLGK
jgi:hypothetical protein